jgi:hypothetical protein
MSQENEKLNAASPNEIADELRSHLITNYEHAINRGLGPQRALAVVLSWAASETDRLQESGKSGPIEVLAVEDQDTGAGEAGVFTLAYHSKNCLPGLDFSPSGELAKILDVARARNSEAGITGVLLFNAERFVQILEGPEDAVLKIFESIKRDPRHTAVTVLMTGRKPKRHFETWSMALVGISREARAYCWYLTRQHDFKWDGMPAEELCRIMLHMISLDRMSQLRG